MKRAHDRASMCAIREFSNSIASLAIVKEDLGICTNTSEMVARRGISQILHELRVGLDGL